MNILNIKLHISVECDTDFKWTQKTQAHSYEILIHIMEMPEMF